jgi:hypothetical protein
MKTNYAEMKQNGERQASIETETVKHRKNPRKLQAPKKKHVINTKKTQTHHISILSKAEYDSPKQQSALFWWHQHTVLGAPAAAQ